MIAGQRDRLGEGEGMSGRKISPATQNRYLQALGLAAYAADGCHRVQRAQPGHEPLCLAIDDVLGGDRSGLLRSGQLCEALEAAQQPGPQTGLMGAALRRRHGVAV